MHFKINKKKVFDMTVLELILLILNCVFQAKFSMLLIIKDASDMRCKSGKATKRAVSAAQKHHSTNLRHTHKKNCQ